MRTIERSIHAHDIPPIPYHIARHLPSLFKDLWFAQEIGLEVTALRVKGRVTAWYDAASMTYYYKQEIDDDEIEF